jgi:sigma-B regulation protein RsbU (phosphoserine phosphatase)
MMNILVIDDDSTICLVLSKSLTKQGYQVALASNGLQGIELARQLRPALIICDWMMPGLDGLQVCRQIKAMPELSTTFFILLTARDTPEDRILGLDTGADEFLSKPIHLQELKARVRAGLRIHQLTQDLHLTNRELEHERLEAAQYLQSLLPVQVETPIKIASRFLPSRQLGGDCFDYYWLDRDRLALYLLDVSGHGLGATLPALSVLQWMRSRNDKDRTHRPHQPLDRAAPARVLDALNQAFEMEQYQDKYFTIWYGIYHRTRRQLVYASAGHPPALLLAPEGDPAGSVRRLHTPGLPIGMFSEARYEQDCCAIAPGSTLYLFSDGAYELHRENGTRWNLEEFVKLLVELHQHESADLDTLLHRLRHIETQPIFDDDLSILQLDFLEN